MFIFCIRQNIGRLAKGNSLLAVLFIHRWPLDITVLEPRKWLGGMVIFKKLTVIFTPTWHPNSFIWSNFPKQFAV